MLLLLAITAALGAPPPPVEARMLMGSRPQIRLGEAALRDLGRCARAAARRGAVVGGSVEVELDVLAGKVLRAEATEVPQDRPALAECVQRRARRWKLPAEVDGEVRAGATIQAEVGGSVVPLTDPPAVQQVLAHYPEIRACYDDRLQAQPSLKGRLGLQLLVEDGVVTEVAFTGAELTDEALLLCIEGAATRWTFEAGRSGTVATTIVLTP